MKWIVWGVGGTLALLWTGALALLAQLVSWGSGALQRAGDATVSLPSAPAEWPAWLSVWIDPAALEAWRDAAMQALQSFQAALPFVGTAAGWLEPVVWLAWGVGLLVILAGAGGTHWLLSRRGAAPA